MRQDKQFESLVVVEHRVEKLEKIIHLHNYYEFIFIKSGAGNHYLNDELTTFTAGNLFFISPRDRHSLEIAEPATLISIRFNEYAKGRIKALQKKWKGEFSSLKKGRSQLNIKVSFADKDVQVAAAIFNLLSTLKNDILSNEAIIYLQLIALVSLIERNLSYGKDTVTQLQSPLVREKSESLLAYIHRHISRPEMLTAAKIAAHHGCSVNYIGLYFKNKIGMNLQAYVNQCRQTIIGRKLLTSDVTIAELVAGFGFTDASHFNKSFKRYWGMSVSAYRLTHQQA